MTISNTRRIDGPFCCTVCDGCIHKDKLPSQLPCRECRVINAAAKASHFVPARSKRRSGKMTDPEKWRRDNVPGYWDKDLGGRPREHKQKSMRRDCSLTEDHWTMARLLGGGNASAGIKRALEAEFERTEW